MHASDADVVGKTCRTDRYTMAYQLQQFGGALQFVAQFEPQPTAFRIAIMRQLREDVACVVPPDSMRPIPMISDDISMGDLIIAAEMTRSTLVAAMDPQEQEEHVKLASSGPPHPGSTGIGFRRAVEQPQPVLPPVR